MSNGQKAPAFGTRWADVASLGVEDEMLVEAVFRGEVARDSVSQFAPRTRGGFDAWSERVEAVREFLVPPLGWRSAEPYNYPTVISPCGRIAIGFAAGDAATGDISALPMTKRSVGPATLYALSAQLSLFDSSVRGGGTGPLTWLLLTNRINDEVVRAEISLPKTIDEASRVVGWQYRHILGSFDLTMPPSGGGLEAPEPPVQSEVLVDPL